MSLRRLPYLTYSRRNAGASGSRLGLLLLCLLLGTAGRLAAQDQVRSFYQPILRVDGDGHHAQIRSLVWRDGKTLLSAGEDKVVKVWDLADAPRLARTIRPPIWRGSAGIIYSLALSSKVDDRGQSLLAVGGLGVENLRGDLTVYRFPGLNNVPSGDPVARLLSQRVTGLLTNVRPDPNSIGHTDSVLAQAFDPSGQVLATGGRDGRVILWNWNGQTFRPHFALPRELGAGARGEAVNAVAFTPDGKSIVAGGARGSVRVWDVENGALRASRVVEARPAAPPRVAEGEGWPVNTLAVSPDGRWIVAGLDGGRLIYLLSAPDLNQLFFFPSRQGQGSVLSVTFRPGGDQFAISLVRDAGAILREPYRLECDVETRAMPDGHVLTTRSVSGLVYACAYSPDGNTLAYGGGWSETIMLEDPNRPAAPKAELKGRGTGIFDIGFTQDARTVGFTREPVNRPDRYESFDFSKRARNAVPRAELPSRAITQADGWSVNVIQTDQLEAVAPDGRRVPIALDGATEKRWWSYSFIPARADKGHGRLVLAVGTTGGVSLFELEGGTRTRVFAGHSGPVLSLAPSPDGRWLATGSSDQTVMLWTLAGCDRVPPFGATFQPGPRGGATITAITPHSFAEGAGLEAGDVILEAVVDRPGRRLMASTAEQFAGLAAAADEAPPGTLVGTYVLDFDIMPFGSTKRDVQALALDLGTDGEWVVWMPKGFYDTSIEGDSKLLGWHTNPVYDRPVPTDFVPIVTHARKMRQPAVLDKLWQTADVGQALSLLPPNAEDPIRVAQAEPPPKIVFASTVNAVPAPGTTGVVTVPNPQINMAIAAAGKSPIREHRVYLDGSLISRTQLAQPLTTLSEPLKLALPPDRLVRLLVAAVNEAGTERTQAIDLVFKPAQPPAPAPVAKPRLVVVTIGVDSFQNPTLPKVSFASRDATQLSRFFKEHLVPPSGDKPFGEVVQVELKDATATVASVQSALENLKGELASKTLHPGDVVAVYLDSHVLVHGIDGSVAMKDTGTGDPPGSTIPTRLISETLGKLADAGCRPVLFLDGVHEGTLPEGLKSDIKEWVRELQQKQKVTTFVASKEGPSGVDRLKRQGRFASGLLGAFEAGGAAGGRKDRSATYSLEEFKTAVAQVVSDLSERRQDVGCYVPDTIPIRTPFAKPEP